MDILSMILSRNQGNFTTTTESVRTVLTGVMADNMYQHSEAIQLVEGQEYTIVLSDENGELVIGTSVAKNSTMPYIGNLSLFFGDEVENTGEIFCVIVDTSNNMTMVNCQAANGITVIIRTKEKKTVIRSELIPGAVLPVVELETEPTAEGELLTEAEAAKMDEVFALGLPIVGKFVYDSSLQTTSIFYHTILGTNNAFVLNAGTLIFTIHKIDDRWGFFVEEPE